MLYDRHFISFKYADISTRLGIFWFDKRWLLH